MAKINDDAFVEEIGNVKKTAFGLAYLVLKNTFDCEDAMSAAIIKAYANRDKLQKRSSFRAWFLRILRNESYTVLRERSKVFGTDTVPEIPQPFPDTSLDLDLHDAIMQLTEEQRNALYLRQEGYSLQEIGAVMNIPVGTVKSRISRAKDTLRTILEEQ